MKITFIHPNPNTGGGCRVVGIYAKALADRGHEVTIVCASPSSKSFITRIKDTIKERKFTRHPSAEELLENSHFNSVRPAIVIQKNKEGPILSKDVPDADIIIATWWETAEWLAEFPSSKGKKFYFIQGHEIFPPLPAERSKLTYKLPLKKLTVAQWLVDVMKDNYGDDDVALIHNGVDHNLFYPDRIKSNDIDMVQFCTIYAPVKIKGLDITFAAFEKARKEKPSIRLVVFGAGKLTKDYPLPEGAIYIENPSQAKIREIYAGSIAYIFSSRSEGFGLPILEALACGCPVIATKAGCAPDFIVNGVNGYLNDIDGVGAQSASILRMSRKSKAQWSDFSDAAILSVSGLSWDIFGDMFERALMDID